MIGASAAALVLGSLLAWFIVRGIIVPLNAMTGAMTNLAAGNGSVEIPEMRSRSELGAMARAVDVFKQNADKIAAMLTAEVTTREIGEVISSAAAGDLYYPRIAGWRKVDFSRTSADRSIACSIRPTSRSANSGEKARHTAISAGEASAAGVSRSPMGRSSSQSGALTQVATALRESTDALEERLRQHQGGERQGEHGIPAGAEGLVSVERLAGIVDAIAQNSRKVNQITQVIAQIANRIHDPVAATPRSERARGRAWQGLCRRGPRGR